MMGGLAYMTGPEGRPLRAGSSVNDIMGGLFGAIGVLAALHQRDKAAGLIEGHEDQVNDGIDKAADLAEDKLGAEHADQIDAAADKAKDVVDGL